MKIQDSYLGEIEVIVNPRLRCTRVRIEAEKLWLELPENTSIEIGLKFVKENQEKIKRRQEKIPQTQSTVIDEFHNLQTRSFVTEIRASTERKVFYFSLKNNVLQIEYPATVDVKSTKAQEKIKQGIVHFLRKEAKANFPEMLLRLAKTWNFSYRSIKIQSSSTRWGSCSGKKDINLSLYLGLLPNHLVEYVMLHELCHTKEMNHGPKFWDLMNKVTDGKSATLRNELKNYKCRL